MPRTQVSAVLAIGQANAASSAAPPGVRICPFSSCRYAVDNDFFQWRAGKLLRRVGAGGRNWVWSQARPVLNFSPLKLQERKRWRRPVGGDLIALRTPRPYLLVVGEAKERQKLESSKTAADPESPAGSASLGSRNHNRVAARLHLCDVFVLPTRH